VFETYDRTGLSLWQRMKFAVPHRAIELFRASDGALTAAKTRELVRDTLCSITGSTDPPRVV
jgi:hypothetical protein